ncbi:TetR/AcrR family transcriptional regulator [Kribbella sp. DT2]|uniref:TetR/AcrR family transcriptional regulator n=1 Tax=Kribbella sp. DT2 TaxID=3393427 RepID=UPI003CE971AE
MAEQRERILAAAARVTGESGLEKVSVRAVAGAAGIGMGTLRHYFPTQRDLHDALVRRLLDDQLDDFAIADARLDAGDRLVRCMVQFLPADEESRPLLEIWFGLYHGALRPESSSLARQFLEVSSERARERIASWLRVLADEGRFDSARSAETTMLLSSLSSGLCLELLTPGTPLTVESAKTLLSTTVRSVIEGGRS